MTELIGNLSLGGAVIAAAGAILASVAAMRMQSQSMLALSRWMIACILALMSTASVALLIALINSDFRFVYVAGYTERALPIGYKLAAFWAGQEGSLLLWGWILAALCTIAAVAWRNERGNHVAIANATLAVTAGFFAILLLFTANPFHMFDGNIPANGRGLNPQLQDIGMIIHPPLLFIGYAGFAIPFAMLLGILASNRAGTRWMSLIRRWVLFAWLFLGAGIILGGWWAYVELGWGGYWAWDPVENASLLPWLTGTALVHSIMVQQHRNMFKRWTASLIAITFLLCIFGTYLTRSGVIDSVHAFAPSLLGTFFLVSIITGIAVSLGLMIWRWKSLAPEHELEGLISREGAFLASNVLLVIMMLVTLVGTIFPIISGLFVNEPITVKPDFYDKIVAPMALGLVALMAVAPVLAFGAQAAQKIIRSLVVPAIAAVLVMACAAVMITTNLWALLCIAIVTVGTATVIVDFIRSINARHRSTGEFWLTCAVRLIDGNHKRYGGQIAHLGVMLIVIGVAGSSLFSSEIIHRLKPGEAAAMERYTLRFIQLDEVRAANFTAVQATVELTDSKGVTRTMTPQRRFYDTWKDQPNSEVAVHSTLREDVYFSLAGWEDNGQLVALQVKINPLVVWIWIGGIVMSFGGVFCMMPQLLPKPRTARAHIAEAKSPAFEPVGAFRAEVSV